MQMKHCLCLCDKINDWPGDHGVLSAHWKDRLAHVLQHPLEVLRQRPVLVVCRKFAFLKIWGPYPLPAILPEGW